MNKELALEIIQCLHDGYGLGIKGGYAIVVTEGKSTREDFTVNHIGTHVVSFKKYDLRDVLTLRAKGIIKQQKDGSWEVTNKGRQAWVKANPYPKGWYTYQEQMNVEVAEKS